MPTSGETPDQAEAGMLQTVSGRRRTFFIWMIRILPSLMGASLLIPLLGYVSSPALRRRTDVWTSIGKVADVPSGEPQELEYASRIKVGPDLSYVADQRLDRQWYTRHYRDPQSVSPGSIMPPFPLDEKDLNDLASYMLSLKSGETTPVANH